MKDIINFINESMNDIKYAIRYYYYADEKMSWSYQSSLDRAQKFVQKMQKQGINIYEIYEIPSDNIKEFKSLLNKRGDNENKLASLYNKHWDKSEIKEFLNIK